eukprot:gene17697-24225_t
MSSLLLLQWPEKLSDEFGPLAPAEIEGILRDEMGEYGLVMEVGLHATEAAAWLTYKEVASVTAALAHTESLMGSVPAITRVDNLAAASEAVGPVDQEDGALQMDTLAVPKLEKQWLISPPPSPPVGWKPILEDPPVVNVKLVEALMGLDPRKPRELHAANEVTFKSGRRASAPAINVVLVDSDSSDDEEVNAPANGRKLNFVSMPPAWGKQPGMTHGAPWHKGDKTLITKMPPRRRSSEPVSVLAGGRSGGGGSSVGRGEGATAAALPQIVQAPAAPRGAIITEEAEEQQDGAAGDTAPRVAVSVATATAAELLPSSNIPLQHSLASSTSSATPYINDAEQQLPVSTDAQSAPAGHRCGPGYCARNDGWSTNALGLPEFVGHVHADEPLDGDVEVLTLRMTAERPAPEQAEDERSYPRSSTNSFALPQSIRVEPSPEDVRNQDLQLEQESADSAAAAKGIETYLGEQAMANATEGRFYM